MERHFLYLPLYFAEEKQWFGLVPEGFRPVTRSIEDPTDQAVLNRLLHDRDRFWFAVCDPIGLLNVETDPEHEPVLLASLVVNTAFWAVNQGAHPVKGVDDLMHYDRIITFGEGTTAWAIASTLLGDRKPEDVYITVRPPAELAVLEESGTGTLALTPNILGVQRLIEDFDGRYSVELELGRTPEFGNALVTTLLTRRDVLSREPELVKAVVQALSRATLACRALNSEVIEMAGTAFGHGEYIEAAMDAARESELFPAGLAPTLSTWMKRCELQARAEGRHWDAHTRDEARRTFERFATPYQYLVRGEFERLLEPLLNPRGRDSFLRPVLSLLIVGAVALSWDLIEGPYHDVVSTVLLLGLLVAGGSVLAQALGFTDDSRAATVFWAGWIATVTVVSLLAVGGLSQWMIVALMAMLVLGLGTVLALVRRRLQG